jgi:uncharacterized OsmC-like protein
MDQTTKQHVNGVDAEGLRATIAAVASDPGKGAVSFRVRTAWKGGMRSETTAAGASLAGERIARSFRFATDEPLQLFGTDGAANPQEHLLGALAACMVVGWVAGASLRGVRLESLEIEAEGRLDLAGFLGVDALTAPGHETIQYRVRVRGDAPRETFAAIHEHVRRTSPNFFNLSRPILLEGELDAG